MIRKTFVKLFSTAIKPAFAGKIANGEDINPSY